MDTKVALDMEIAVFRRLLESEEDRLGILGPDDLGKHQITINFSYLFVFPDDSYDEDTALARSTPEITKTVTTNSESNFQRKITVSQTQL